MTNHLTAARGIFTVVMHVNWSDATATDSHGNNYHAIESVNEDVQVSSYGAVTLTSPGSFLMVAAGSGLDIRVHVLYHFTLNANNTMTSSIDIGNLTCGG
jgi:hypothetical protein